MAMACSRDRRIFWIEVSLFIVAAVGGLSYYIWYITYYKYNIADPVHTIKFSETNYEFKVIWRREYWQCTAELYQGRNLQHEIDLGTWFTANERDNVISLTSGYGPGMRISVHKDSTTFASIEFCTSDPNDCCTYFNVQNLQWYVDSQYEITLNLPFATTDAKHSVDRFSDFQCRNQNTTPW